MSDQHRAHGRIAKIFAAHSTVNHLRREYAHDDVHTNTAESFGSLLERAKLGVYHYMSRKHLSRYLSELSFRWDHRIPIEKVTKGGNRKTIMKPMPFLEIISSLLSGCVGKQLRRTKNFGIRSVINRNPEPYFCL